MARWSGTRGSAHGVSSGTLSAAKRASRQRLAMCLAVCLLLTGMYSILFLVPRPRPGPRPGRGRGHMLGRVSPTPRDHVLPAPRGLVDPGSVEYRIPRILHMTHSKDLLRADPRELDEDEVILAENVARTVAMLGDWAEEVMFWTDAGCMEAARRVPHGERLAKEMETLKGMYVADVCRGVVLYLCGGLYLDVDVVARESPAQWLNPEAEFVTAMEAGRQGYFQAILGALPQHPVVAAYLDVIDAHLRGTDVIEEDLGNGYFQWMGTVAMWRALQRAPKAHKQNLQVLQEFHGKWGTGLSKYGGVREDSRALWTEVVQPVPRGMPSEKEDPGCCCDYLVGVQTRNASQPMWRPIFHSRVALPSSNTCIGSIPFPRQMQAVGLSPASSPGTGHPRPMPREVDVLAYTMQLPNMSHANVDANTLHDNVTEHRGGHQPHARNVRATDLLQNTTTNRPNGTDDDDHMDDDDHKDDNDHKDDDHKDDDDMDVKDHDEKQID